MISTKPFGTPRRNGRTQCCGREPMLRVQENAIAYICAACGKAGGKSHHEGEAAVRWELDAMMAPKKRKRRSRKPER